MAHRHGLRMVGCPRRRERSAAPRSAPSPRPTGQGHVVLFVGLFERTSRLWRSDAHCLRRRRDRVGDPDPGRAGADPQPPAARTVRCSGCSPGSPCSRCPVVLARPEHDARAAPPLLERRVREQAQLFPARLPRSPPKRPRALPPSPRQQSARELRLRRDRADRGVSVVERGDCEPRATRPPASPSDHRSRSRDASAAAAATARKAAPSAASSGSLPLIQVGLRRNASPETAMPPASAAQNGNGSAE